MDQPFFFFFYREYDIKMSTYNEVETQDKIVKRFNLKLTNKSEQYSKNRS